MQYQLLNGSNLAYIGDAYYELEIRKYLINKNITKTKDLQKECIKYVSAKAHHMIVLQLSLEFTNEEQKIFLRGRNKASTSHRKNLIRMEYLNSSGFEAVIGYLYLKEDFERLNYLVNKSIEIVETIE